jgi:hypothetical protein
MKFQDNCKDNISADIIIILKQLLFQLLMLLTKLSKHISVKLIWPGHTLNEKKS